MIDPIHQAIEIVRQCWTESAPPFSKPCTYEQAKKHAIEAQEEKDWLVASSFRHFTKDSPLSYFIILWRQLGTGDTIAKLQIKPVLVHWDAELEEFLIVDITRVE